MEKVTKYIADDGKEFDDEEECIKYEIDTDKNKKVIALDDELEIIDNKDIYYLLENVKYMNVESEKMLEYIKDMGNHCGFVTPNDIGLFYYDSEDDEYIKIDKKIENLKEELFEFEKAKKLLIESKNK